MEVKPGYKQTEAGVVPDDWRVVEAGTIGRFQGGSGFPIVYQGASSGDYPFFKVSDMNNEGNETFMLRANNYISESTRRRLGTKVFPPQSIVFAKIGAAVFLERKKLLAAPSCVDNNMAGFVLSDPGVDYRFVYYFFLSLKFGSLVSATALPSLSGAVLNRIKIPLPPTRAEQEAIAGTLSDADGLIESLEQILAKKRCLKQGVMQELLTSKTRLPGYSGDWKATALGQFGKCYRGVSYNPNVDLSPGDGESTVRLLRSNNVQDKEIVFNDMQFVDRRRVSAEQVLRDDDVLICMANGSRELVGKSARFESGDGYAYTFGAFMGCFRSSSETADPRFVFYLFQTEKYRSQIAVLLAGSSINNLTPGNVEALVVDVPTEKAEQAAIVAILSDMDAEIAMLEAKLSKTRQLKQGMMQELLTGRSRLV
ncbi:restriction endonuclease subunit S [Corallococcus sp. RDP092CA]|uniref:restriction endonuclease subunit S n=1 Tax=Corallococcus sp. RDP092CA TaxID=3109369 RepID=UPI0035AEE32B